jgi:hypothetical protein
MLVRLRSLLHLDKTLPSPYKDLAEQRLKKIREQKQEIKELNLVCQELMKRADLNARINVHTKYARGFITFIAIILITTILNLHPINCARAVTSLFFQSLKSNYTLSMGVRSELNSQSIPYLNAVPQHEPIQPRQRKIYL